MIVFRGKWMRRILYTVAAYPRQLSTERLMIRCGVSPLDTTHDILGIMRRLVFAEHLYYEPSVGYFPSPATMGALQAWQETEQREKGLSPCC